MRVNDPLSRLVKKNTPITENLVSIFNICIWCDVGQDVLLRHPRPYRATEMKKQLDKGGIKGTLWDTNFPPESPVSTQTATENLNTPTTAVLVARPELCTKPVSTQTHFSYKIPYKREKKQSSHKITNKREKKTISPTDPKNT